MTSVRKPYNDRLGYVASLKRPNNKGYAVIYDNRNNQLGIETEHIWVTTKEPEGEMVSSSTLPKARLVMKNLWKTDNF